MRERIGYLPRRMPPCTSVRTGCLVTRLIGPRAHLVLIGDHGQVAGSTTPTKIFTCSSVPYTPLYSVSVPWYAYPQPRLLAEGVGAPSSYWKGSSPA